MELIFEETANRHQCEAEVQVNDLVMQCTFSTSKTVTVPAGYIYTGGELLENQDAPAATYPICRNHEARLKFLSARL